MAKTQKERIYDLLEERGPKGVLNIELNEICFRYGGRLHELGKEGCRIRTTKVKGSVWIHSTTAGQGQSSVHASEGRARRTGVHGVP